MDSDELAEVRNHCIGFVFQSFNLLARTSAIENVETPLIYAGIHSNERKQRAAEMFEHAWVSVTVMHHLPNQLSGGEKQRVALARALITRSTILLADEPTGNLDTHTSEEIMDILGQLNREQNMTIVLITHENEIAARARRTLLLRDGLLQEVT